ncbi:MAG: CRTAC1 family protein [Phycisphaerales bacterium]
MKPARGFGMWSRRMGLGCVLVLSPVDAPAQPLAPFTEEAFQRGVNYVVEPPTFSMYGTGVGFADLDNDADPDLVVLGRADGRIGVYENDGTGRFTSRTSGTMMPTNRFYNGLSFADVDHDGDLDIYVSTYGSMACLFRNNGNFTFTNIAASAGVANTGAGQGLSWGDFDNDGWLDLYLANRTVASEGFPQPNRLYRNNHNSTFTEIAGMLGVDDPGVMSFQGGFFDYDLDGDADLYVAEDKGLPGCVWHNRFWRNDGATFTDISASSGAGACMDGMCFTTADFNADGLVDFYVTNIPPGNKLFIGRPDGTFTDEAPAAGVVSDNISWGAHFWDFDNDGRLDLFVTNQSAPNRLYRQVDSWPCPDIAAGMGVNFQPFSFTCALADIDNDGDLDLAVSAVFQPLKIYINHEGERRNWVRLRVISDSARRDAIGAIARVTSVGRTQMLELTSTGGFKSQNQAILHFGLDQATVVDQIEVTWPAGGPGARTRMLRNYPANRTWTIYPESKLGDVDHSGTMTSADFMGFMECFFAAAPAGYQPGCEMMDFDGDGQPTSIDFFAFLDRFFR